MRNVCFFESPVGDVLRIEDDGEFVKEVEFVLGTVSPKDQNDSPIGAEVKRQLQEYYEGKRKEFSLPINPDGTEFQHRVWKALCEIPYGQVRSYKEVAEAAGCPRGARAVGNANNRNHICIIIPCHRCISGDGTIGGFDCGTDIKARLLEVEGATYKKV